MIRVDPSGVREVQLFVDVDLSDADPESLRIGRFYERHPSFARPIRGSSFPEVMAAHRVEETTRGAVVFGSNPAFDTETLAGLLYRNRLTPAWHYRPEDVASLVAGYLIGGGVEPMWPLRSGDLSRAIGIDPDEYERHTALGDCRWVLAQLKVVAPELIAAAQNGGDQ